MGDDDRAHSDRHIVADRNEPWVGSLDQRRRADRHILSYGNAAHAVQPDAGRRVARRVEGEDLQEAVLRAAQQGIAQGFGAGCAACRGRRLLALPRPDEPDQGLDQQFPGPGRPTPPVLRGGPRTTRYRIAR